MEKKMMAHIVESLDAAEGPCDFYDRVAALARIYCMTLSEVLVWFKHRNISER